MMRDFLNQKLYFKKKDMCKEKEILIKEETKCRFCNEKAMYETQTNNVYICEKNRCHLDYVSETIKPIKK